MRYESYLFELTKPWCALSQKDKTLLQEVGKENLVMWVDGAWKCQKDSQPGWNVADTYRIKRGYLMNTSEPKLMDNDRLCASYRDLVHVLGPPSHIGGGHVFWHSYIANVGNVKVGAQDNVLAACKIEIWELKAEPAVKREFVKMLKQAPVLSPAPSGFSEIFSVKTWWGSNAMMDEGKNLWRAARFVNPSRHSSLGRFGPWIFERLEDGGVCSIQVWHEQTQKMVAEFNLREVQL